MGACMKVLVVSGFLGAGKTTFIQELVRRTGKYFVIYENEYGEADVDAARLRADSDLKVWESVENCICCTGKQDFASSVLTISNTLDPEFLVVEPTGVARLSNVMANLAQVSWERIELLPPITIVDAVSCSAQRRGAPEVFDDQVRSAPLVIASKVGGTGSAEEVAHLAGELNPAAELVTSDYRVLPDEWWESLLESGAHATPSADTSDKPGEEDAPETLSLRHASLPTPAHLMWLLDAVSAGTFGHVSRAKGTLACGSQLVRFDVVERAWAVTGAEGSEGESCVFIGNGLHQDWLVEAFVPAEWRDAAVVHHHHHHHHDGHDGPESPLH